MRLAAGSVEYLELRRSGRIRSRIQRLRHRVEYVHDEGTLSRLPAPLAVDGVFAVPRLGAA